MKKILFLLLNVVLILSSCHKADSYLVWYGPKQVSSDSQKVNFSPDKTIDEVTFKVVAAYSYSDVNEEYITTQDVIYCNESQKVTMENGRQRIESDWFIIYQDNSDIIIELTECDCPARRLTICFDDTVTTGGNQISLLQVGQ